MNWRRGLLRAWLLVSALWIAGWATMAWIDGFANLSRWAITYVTLVDFVPPIVLLGLGAATAWVMKGFRRVG